MSSFRKKTVLVKSDRRLVVFLERDRECDRPAKETVLLKRPSCCDRPLNSVVFNILLKSDRPIVSDRHVVFLTKAPFRPRSSTRVDDVSNQTNVKDRKHSHRPRRRASTTLYTSNER